MKTEKFDFYDSTNIKSYNLDSQIQYQLKMLDSLDAFTRRHSENVASITCRLCEYLGLDRGFIIYCTTCAYIHDIGKQFIPPAILQKPSKLTDEEYEIMKTHTTIGYNMCMQDPKLKPYYAGTLYHHEGLDGTGYPNGVKGKEIPYEAQIIRVADEFEAITAKRQYKTHIGIVDTLKILIDHAKPTVNRFVGKIDPDVLRALFKVVIDDTKNEIYAYAESVDFIEGEIFRLNNANKYLEKMNKTSNEHKKEVFKSNAKYFLRANETIENIPTELSELQTALEKKKEHIKTLNDEIKQIKHLKIK